MRQPRLRLSIRWTLVAVAILAIVFAGIIGLRRRGEHLRQVSIFHNDQAAKLELRLFSEPGISKVQEQVLGGRHEWHTAMFRKYQDAATRPWLPVGPDPPEPQ